MTKEIIFGKTGHLQFTRHPKRHSGFDKTFNFHSLGYWRVYFRWMRFSIHFTHLPF